MPARRRCSPVAHRGDDDVAAAIDGLPADVPLLLHLDGDVLDPSVAPGVDVPAGGGWDVPRLRDEMAAIADTGRLVAVSLCCGNPRSDVEQPEREGLPRGSRAGADRRPPDRLSGVRQVPSLVSDSATHSPPGWCRGSRGVARTRVAAGNPARRPVGSSRRPAPVAASVIVRPRSGRDGRGDLALVRTALAEMPSNASFSIVRGGRWGSADHPNPETRFVWEAGESWTQYVLAPRLETAPTGASWLLLRDTTPGAAGIAHPLGAWRFGTDWLVRVR